MHYYFILFFHTEKLKDILNAIVEHVRRNRFQFLLKQLT